MKIVLTPYVFEDGLLDFIFGLGHLNCADNIVLDLSRVTHYIPAAILALVVKIDNWRQSGKSVDIMGYEDSTATQYLQRIDFFSTCEIHLEENFKRHDPLGRFVSIRKIGRKIDQLSNDIATCMLPELANTDNPDESGPFDCLVYAVSELATNTEQHSKGRAYALAQYTESKDIIRVCIADTGIGILESFLSNGSDYWYEDMSEIDAIKKALEPEVSSRKHLSLWAESPNHGVGLTLLYELATKLKGEFILVSQNAYFCLNEERLFSDKVSLGGTLCSFTFRRRDLHNFGDILYECKQNAGLIKNEFSRKGLFK
jgi:hypothetical protein